MTIKEIFEAFDKIGCLSFTTPKEIAKKSLRITGDIKKIISDLEEAESN